MQLLKLTDKVISDSCKKIYLLKHSDNYLAELKERYEDICNIIIVSSDYNNYLVEDGLLVIAVDYYREAYEKVVEELGQSRDINIYYFPNKETEYEEYYRDKYSESELKDIIIFRSGPHIDSYIEGMDFADNARALFEYMLKNNYNNKYKLVWFVKESCDYIDRYKAYKNVEFVNLSWSISNCQRERDTYYYYLCNSKYIFFTDAYGIARNCREDQIRIQLWHGCGFKTRLNFQPCKKRYEYMIVTSQLYGDIHSRLFGLDDEQILVTGLPKEDWLYEASNDEFYEVINKDINEYKKIIIWLPTYRQADMVLNQNNGYCIEGGIGLPVLDSLEKLEGINEILKKNNGILVDAIAEYCGNDDIERIREIGFYNIIDAINGFAISHSNEHGLDLNLKSDELLIKKIAAEESRTMTNMIEYLIKKEIARFEADNSPISVTEEDLYLE